MSAALQAPPDTLGRAEEHLSTLMARARAAGADACDTVLVAGTSVSVSRRLGRTEQLERAEGVDLGLRVFVGRRSAIVSASSLDPARFDALAQRAVAMARVVPEDPYGGLSGEVTPPQGLDALDLCDPTPEPSVEALTERAACAEDAARSVPGITNSEGGEASYGRTRVWLATSDGFAGSYTRTGHSVSATVLAGAGTGMERDYDYHSAMHLEDLDDAATIGRSAAERALARLNPTRPRTTTLSVVYHPRCAGSLIGHLVAGINGASIARGTSFLKDSLGRQVFSRGIRIIDDPRRRRGPRSRPFDGEGTPTATRAIVDDGVLDTWLLDSRTGRQLGMATTGHAARGTGGPPSPSSTNLYLAPGDVTPAELMSDIREGLFVTELIGSAINGLTGDYSRGASGFMIRDGALAEPVSEITIAGNLVQMFARMRPANDLVFRRGTDSPSVRVDGMTLAGA